LAETVVRLTDSLLKDLVPPPDDPKRAKQVLGWEPRWQLEDGLKRTIAYFQK
jgi:UDP-glucuronate decarboxylase